MDKIFNKMPDIAPDGPLGSQKGKATWTSCSGLLSPIGDVAGQVLDKGLKPIGHFTGQIGNPAGEALSNAEFAAKKEIKHTNEDNNKPDSEKPGGVSIGGQEQTAKNPLGL